MRSITAHDMTLPALGFGTWALRGETARQMVEHALGVGYRHIDTAQMYDNEEWVGQALSSSGVSRDEYFLTTKIGNGNHAAANVLSSTHESLRKLGVDYLDLLLIHWPIQTVPLGETLGAMLDLQDQVHDAALPVLLQPLADVLGGLLAQQSRHVPRNRLRGRRQLAMGSLVG